MTSSSFSPALDGPRLPPLSGGAAKQLIVILHGYGADGMDLIDLGRVWQQALPDAAFVAPNAPDPLPFEALGGKQWFSLEERTPREYEIGAQAAQPALDRFLDVELGSRGLNDTALALVGFSQGAMMTFQAGLRRKTPPACLMAYSGLLPGIAALPILPAPPPTLIVHGADDDVVPAYHLEAARTALLQAGVTVEAHCLDDLGHGIDERGLILGRQFLEKAFL